MKTPGGCFMKFQLKKERIPYYVDFGISLILVLCYFMPFLYTLNQHNVSFVNGFSLFVFMEDTISYLHNGSVFVLACLIFSGIIALANLFSFFVKEEYLKTIKAVSLSLDLFRMGLLIASMVLFSKCGRMNIYLEFGFYVQTIIASLDTMYQIGLLIIRKLHASKTKAS